LPISQIIVAIEIEIEIGIGIDPPPFDTDPDSDPDPDLVSPLVFSNGPWLGPQTYTYTMMRRLRVRRVADQSDHCGDRNRNRNRYRYRYRWQAWFGVESSRAKRPQRRWC
jgi:hypothetical protein